MVYIECNPDELLINKLGFTNVKGFQHKGKSRIFNELKKKETQNQIALVDEDPGSAMTSYEKSLNFKEKLHGISYYEDNKNNKVFILSGNLEDWIIYICKQGKIKISDFKLPEKSNDLHDIINNRLNNFAKLLDHLLETKNPAILQLKDWLNIKK